MNQAIQFLEDEYFDAEKQAVIFSALESGHKLTCAISAAVLGDQFGEGDPLSLFEQNRWDIEELAEKAITSQLDDINGCYWLSI
ncbi:DUF1488 domain-containing protein [Rosenbergiella sp. S61]|uniref:DUF1488 domain-containing protein n=1 Tax=Rosenbergiella gaditana TaxID=2726987 RepID=A0ABS5T007_9GAMM|nr:DUF1488 domain-containing protein [Rosenbergiella gaditana]MBT0725679.1 DUF1488 domain-containing protein [Rosenbergiella gaditana]